MHRWAVVLWLVTRASLVQAEDKAASPAPLPSAPRCELPGWNVTDPKNPALTWCKNPADEPDAVNICIDAQTGCIAAIKNGLSSNETGLLIPPNHGVVVTVHAPGKPEADIADVSINLAGTVGLVLPATYGETKGTFDITAALDLLLPTKERCVPGPRNYVARFAPRGTGTVPLTVTIIRDPAAAQSECERDQKPTTEASKPPGRPAGKPPNHTERQQPADALPIDGAGEQPDGAHAAEPGEKEAGKAKPAEDKKPQEPGNAEPMNLVDLLVDDPASHSVTCRWAVCAVTVVPPPPAEKPPSGGSTPPKGKVFSYEFYVPKTFGGALRIGFGAIRVGGLAHAYGVRKVVGTDFSQIVDGGADPVSAELVVGYAPFLFAKASAARGRTYTPDENWWARFAPFFGVGVLSSSPAASKAEFLRSFYVGFEYELTPGSSIAIAGVVRRVDALASGFTVGMTVDSAASITRTTFDTGWGLVFNVTPGFFQFAASALPK